MIGIPEFQHPITIEAFIEAAWNNRRKNLDIIRETRNPLRPDAIKELQEAKQLATDAIDRNLINNQRVMTTARLLSSLDIQTHAALSNPNISKASIVSA